MTELVSPPKADPETLILRAQPRRVVRFKRHVLVTGAAVACVAIAGIAWLGLGLSPPKIIPPQATFNPDKVGKTAKPQPEPLAQLPATYADVPAGVPQLGPPLPGDLGGPILEHQQAQVQAGGAATPVQPPAPAVSGMFFPVTPRPPQPAEPPPMLTDRPDNPDSGRRSNSHSLEQPRSLHQVMAGTVIAASLVTGLKSDLPGFVIAQVTQPVLDSVTGQHLLIPQGTRVLGTYEDKIVFGQSRALVVWTRLVLPDGTSLEIDNLPATDTEGYAGLTDRVDYHTRQLLKGVGLSTLLGIAAQGGVGEDGSDLVRVFREAISETANHAGQSIVEKALAIAPSITVRPGWPVRIIVHKDLILQPYKGV